MAATLAAVTTFPTSRTRGYFLATSSRRPSISSPCHSPPPPPPPHCPIPFPPTIKSWLTKPDIKTPAIFSSPYNAFSPSPAITSPAALEAEALLPLKRILLCVSLWLSLGLVLCFLACGSSLAATSDSIRASSFGLKVAKALQRSGWADEAIVFALATLPVLELRGAIPVGYWMHLHPLHLSVLSVLGNMVPVPFIVLYLKRLASFLSGRSASASRFLELLFERAREKAGPVEEFQWLGLMLFVAVPFPGTGAWTGAIIASILDMPFWSAISANFVGVVFAGLLVNLLVNLGLKHAVAVGVVLFFVSTFMWSVLRHLKKASDSK